MMTSYDYELEFSDSESERSFEKSSFEVPEISNRIDEDHRLVCMIVNNLQTQLDSALKRRSEIRDQIIERNFIDDSCQCAQYWLNTRKEPISIVKGNLRGILWNLNKCNCCERHQTKRPSIENGDNGSYDDSGRNEQEKSSDWNLCDCKCRMTCRKIAQTLNAMDKPARVMMDPTNLEADLERALECV